MVRGRLHGTNGVEAPEAGSARPRATRVGIRAALAVALAAGATLVAPGPASAIANKVCKDRGLGLTASNSHRVERALLCLTNQFRHVKGRPMLRRDTRLSTAARRHSRDMVEREYFAHLALDEPGNPAPHGVTPSDRAVDAGWPSTFVGENIAMSFMPATAGALFALWRQSTGHRHNMLDPDFHTAGFGVSQLKGSSGIMGTQKFADAGADTNDRAVNLLVESKRCRQAKQRRARAQRRLRQARKQGAPKKRIKNRRSALRKARQQVKARC